MTQTIRITSALAIVSALLCLTLTSCNDDDDDTIDQPDKYNFKNVDYSGQTARIQLLDELSGKIAKIEENQSVNDISTSEGELRDIFENNGVISADKSLAEKTYNEGNAASDVWQKDTFEQFFTDLTNPSANDTIVDGRFFTSDGVELHQYVEKGLMGAVFYWQATSVYLQNLDEDDNEAPNNSTASEREHHFDEAFGYLGVPKNFLTNSADEVDGEYETSAWFWGSYILSRNDVLNIREPLFNAFLKGRTAIENGNSDKREEAVDKIKTLWEELVAANVVHYINSTLEDMSNNDKYSKWHHWAEAKVFHMCLRYNVDKKISNNDWDYIDTRLKQTPKNITQTELQEANSRLQQVFGFTDSEMTNL